MIRFNCVWIAYNVQYAKNISINIIRKICLILILWIFKTYNSLSNRVKPYFKNCAVFRKHTRLFNLLTPKLFCHFKLKFYLIKYIIFSMVGYKILIEYFPSYSFLDLPPDIYSAADEIFLITVFVCLSVNHIILKYVIYAKVLFFFSF